MAHPGIKLAACRLWAGHDVSGIFPAGENYLPFPKIPWVCDVFSFEGRGTSLVKRNVAIFAFRVTAYKLLPHYILSEIYFACYEKFRDYCYVKVTPAKTVPETRETREVRNESHFNYYGQGSPRVDQ